MNQILWLSSLSVFSALSMNLLLQFGLGLGAAAVRTDRREKVPYIQGVLLFFTVLLLWPFFQFILSPLLPLFFTFALLFPLSALVCYALEFLAAPVIAKIFPSGLCRVFHAKTAYDGLAAAAVFITFTMASRFSEALVLSAGFAAGVLLSLVIVREIRRRAAMEAVPQFLRGVPLTLISTGLLSLIFGSAAAVFLKVLG
jgi:Na+-transporting NADH:ubiquinone oxidoreductase subunit NqrE